ncbi:uncharacterized protein LOC105262382 isoform X1 [Musca domestica]|uniref:Uncharacterized protein LOC105262382 isoform X1 n=1 Tax=Musca domestica TaxID=7370 RepID=A0ABM3UL42_MUSDO|nr:uncharacterized protein LOC105262382 isoform X1 [Musca domestica]
MIIDCALTVTAIELKKREDQSRLKTPADTQQLIFPVCRASNKSIKMERAMNYHEQFIDIYIDNLRDTLPDRVLQKLKRAYLTNIRAKIEQLESKEPSIADEVQDEKVKPRVYPPNWTAEEIAVYEAAKKEFRLKWQKADEELAKLRGPKALQLEYIVEEHRRRKTQADKPDGDNEPAPSSASSSNAVQSVESIDFSPSTSKVVGSKDVSPSTSKAAGSIDFSPSTSKAAEAGQKLDAAGGGGEESDYASDSENESHLEPDDMDLIIIREGKIERCGATYKFTDLSGEMTIKGETSTFTNSSGTLQW